MNVHQYWNWNEISIFTFLSSLNLFCKWWWRCCNVAVITFSTHLHFTNWKLRVQYYNKEITTYSKDTKIYCSFCLFTHDFIEKRHIGIAVSEDFPYVVPPVYLVGEPCNQSSHWRYVSYDSMSICLSGNRTLLPMLLLHVTFSRHLYLAYENHLAPYFRYSVWFSMSKVMLHIWQHNHMQPVSLHQRTSELRTRIPSINNFAATARRPANNISKISDVHITS